MSLHRSIESRASDAEVLGDRIKHFRSLRRLSLRDLATRSGMSASFLSQLERGLTGASAATLMQLSAVLEISVGELFENHAAPSQRVMKRVARPSLPESGGYRKMLPSRPPAGSFEVFAGEFAIGGSTGEQAYTHGDSLEMMVVQRGIVALWLGDERLVLEEGDSIEYRTSVPHRIANIGNFRAEVMWIIGPPTSRPDHTDQYAPPTADG